MKKVHESEPYDLNSLLQLDPTNEAAIVLKLIQMGVIQGEVRLGDMK